MRSGCALRVARPAWTRYRKSPGFFARMAVWSHRTHPCFRTCKFSNYFTDFNNRDYSNDGTLFNVTIYDGKRELRIVDVHWSLTAMTSQLNESGFVIENLYELPRSTSGSSQPDASLWLVILAHKL